MQALSFNPLAQFHVKKDTPTHEIRCASGSLRSIWGSGHKRTSPAPNLNSRGQARNFHVLLASWASQRRLPSKWLASFFSPLNTHVGATCFLYLGGPKTRHKRVDSGLRNHGPGRGELGLEAVCFSSKSRELLSEFEGTRIVQVSKWLESLGGGWVGGSK